MFLNQNSPRLTMLKGKFRLVWLLLDAMRLGRNGRKQYRPRPRLDDRMRRTLQKRHSWRASVDTKRLMPTPGWRRWGEDLQRSGAAMEGHLAAIARAQAAFNRSVDDFVAGHGALGEVRGQGLRLERAIEAAEVAAQAGLALLDAPPLDGVSPGRPGSRRRLSGSEPSDDGTECGVLDGRTGYSQSRLRGI